MTSRDIFALRASAVSCCIDQLMDRTARCNRHRSHRRAMAVFAVYNAVGLQCFTVPVSTASAVVCSTVLWYCKSLKPAHAQPQLLAFQLSFTVAQYSTVYALFSSQCVFQTSLDICTISRHFLNFSLYFFYMIVREAHCTDFCSAFR